jgi:hypothetical protein
MEVFRMGDIINFATGETVLEAVEKENAIEVTPVVIKSLDDAVTEELLLNLVGKMIHVPTNEHMSIDNETGTLNPVNVWFAGTVAGYAKEVLGYDFGNDDALTELKVAYSVLMTDGVGYILSSTKCEIKEITMSEFEEMVTDYKLKQEAINSILLPGRDF